MLVTIRKAVARWGLRPKEGSILSSARAKMTLAGASRPLKRATRSKSTIVLPKPEPFVSPTGTIFSRVGSTLLKSYLQALQRRPLLTKTVAAIGIFAVGDAIVQTQIEGHDDIDVYRLASRACSGAVFVFWVHPWWGFLEPRVQRLVSYHTHPWTNTLTKVLIDQTIGAASVNFLYISYISFVDGLSPTQTADRLKTQLPEQLLAHWMVFPLFNTLNFRYIPLQHRALAQNLISMGWSGFLSHRYRPGGDFDPLKKQCNAVR